MACRNCQSEPILEKNWAQIFGKFFGRKNFFLEMSDESGAVWKRFSRASKRGETRQAKKKKFFSFFSYFLVKFCLVLFRILGILE